MEHCVKGRVKDKEGKDMKKEWKENILLGNIKI